MTLTEIILFTVPGLAEVSDPSIAYQWPRPLMVTRSSKVYDIILADGPVNLQVQYNSAGGKLKFDPTIPFNPGETVNVLIKEP